MNPTFAHNNWPAIKAAIETGNTPVVALLPCGATEAHGPHLPLSTDVIISEGQCAYAQPDLEEAGIEAFTLPSIAYAPADYAGNFAGTISISPDTAKAVILDIANSLQKQGFSALAIANSHFDPANVTMLREVVETIRSEIGLPVAFPDFTRRNLAETLTDEFKSGACHAGQYETSLVMASRPELVDDTARMQAKDNPKSLIEGFKQGATNFEECGGPEAYFGFPSKATAAEGVQSYEILASALVESIKQALK
ncbi:MAG: creatininase family protein [Planctomycetes bacterium]|nr:creatininase family protein [Planctomycetota bacterium]